MSTPAQLAWYASRSTKQVQAELRSARKAFALAAPNRTRSLRARIVCEANEQAIPALEQLLAARKA